MPDITLLTIDLDDTVWPCAPVIARAEAEHFAWLQRQAERLAAAHSVDTLREHRQQTARLRPDLAHDFTAVRTASLELLLAAFGHAPALAQQATRVFLEWRNHVTPYPDAAPVLRELRASYRLVSVTNGNADVRRTPLRDCFHASLSAAIVGAAKPAPAIFHRALASTGARAEQAVHVGDDPWLDVEAARAVGMRSVWVNRGAHAWPSELAPPDVEVADLHGLRHWLVGQRRSVVA